VTARHKRRSATNANILGGWSANKKLTTLAEFRIARQNEAAGAADAAALVMSAS